MKAKAIIILLLTLVLVGCMKEDRGSCRAFNHVSSTGSSYEGYMCIKLLDSQYGHLEGDFVRCSMYHGIWVCEDKLQAGTIQDIHK